MTKDRVAGRLAVAALGIIVVTSDAASAQQRPLVTEDPETVGTGNVLLEAGFDAQRDIFYPASGLRGDLLRAPIIGVSFGFSSSCRATGSAVPKARASQRRFPTSSI